MDLTWEEWRAMKKGLRRKLGTTGWVLLVYYGIMNGAVFLWTFFEMLVRIFRQLLSGDFFAIGREIYSATESGWGYLLAAALGFLILLLWKKPRFWKEQIWAAGKPMKVGSFFALLCVFLGGQLLSQIMVVILELVLNQFGLTLTQGMEALSVDPDNFSMFLYAGILAPAIEEILFRGLILRSLMPYGKRFAIFCSAVTFGLFHGNVIQAPFAFLVGLVLGYAASEYSIGWAMLLHMINNLLLADSLNRLTSGLPEDVSAMILWSMLLIFGIAALVILIVKRKAVREWIHQERINRTCLSCFFSSAGMILFMLVMGAMMVSTLYMLITPL